jgi:murein DD-endopeptidase MepM/ murein hydrolase activator NlpD
MSHNPHPLHNLADALSEDLLAMPAERLLAEAAEEHDDGPAVAAAFDRISARAAAQSRRRRIADRLRALVASIVPQASWKPAMAAVAALAVVVVAGDLYVHVRPNPRAPAPVAAIRDSLSRADLVSREPRMSFGQQPGSIEPGAIEPGAVGGNTAAALPAPAAAPAAVAVASAPPPAPAAPAGVAGEPKRVRTVDIQLGGAEPGPAPAPRPAVAADQLQARIDYERARAALALAEQQKNAGLQSPALAIAATAAPKTAAAPSTAAATPPARAAAPNGPAARRDLAAANPDDALSFRWPLRGRLIAHFGSSGSGTPSNGIDLAAPPGTDIRAAEDGVVAYAGDELKGYGNLILVRHRGDFVTAYAHAGKLLVKRDDTVRRGQVIAKSGRTGDVSTPQLHFEMRKGSTPVDPLEYLPPG